MKFLAKALAPACASVIVSACTSQIARQDFEWKVQLDGGCVPGAISASVPVVSNGTVYIGSSDGAVYAVDAATGAQRWRFQTGAGLPGGTEIIVAPRESDPAEMAGRALDQLGRSRAGGKAQINATPAIDGNTVYIGSWDRTFYALDAMTGKPKWSFDSGLPVMEKAVVHAGNVIFVTGGAQARSDRGNGLVYALDSSSGAKAWVLDTLPDVGSQPKWPSHVPVIKDGVAYITNWNATQYVKGAADTARVYVHAIDPASGKTRWSSKLNGAWPSPPAVTQKYVLFTTSPRENMTTVELHALDSSTGKEKWGYRVIGGTHYTFGTRTRNQWQPPMVVGDDLVLLSTDTDLVGIDINTGLERWHLTEPFRKEPINQVHLGPLLYVITGDTMSPTLGNLHGIDPLTGKLAWSMRMVSRNQIRAVIDGVIYFKTAILRNSLIAVDGITGRELETVWTSLPVGSESYSICSGPVRHGKQLLISTESQSFSGGRPLRGYLYSVAAPAGMSQ